MSEYFNKLLAPDSMSISLKQDLLVSTGKIAVPDKNNIHLEVRTCEIVTEEGWSGTVSRQLHNGHWYIYRELVQFYYARFCTQTECHEWSAAPITACLRHRPLGCFHSECCVDGESMAAPRETSLPHTFTLSARMEKSQVQYFFQSLRYDPTGDRARAAYNLWWCVPNQLYQLFRFAINKPNDEKPAISLQNNNCYALNKSRTENEILSLDHIKNVFPQQYAWMELFTELQQSLRNVEKWYAKNNSCTLYLFGRRWSAEWIGPLKFSFIPIIVFRRQMASVSRVTAVSVIETTLGKNIKWRTEPLCVLA